jgi:hypothetical protein
LVICNFRTTSANEFLGYKLQIYEIAKLQIPVDPASQLQCIYLAGFELLTFDRFPKCVGVVRESCIALLVPGTDGLQILGTPGWRMGEAIGVLVEQDGRQIFQNKSEILEATPERLELLRKFKEDLKVLLSRE